MLWRGIVFLLLAVVIVFIGRFDGLARIDAAASGVRHVISGPNALVSPNTVVVVHWAAGHLMPDDLLPKFAREFSSANHRIASGKRIEVRTVKLDSFEQIDKLESAAKLGRVVETQHGEPTIVTPVVDHWLADLNNRVGRPVVDLRNTAELAISWTGLATYRDMAVCLGWPNKPIGYADIVALRSDPRGWASCPSARAAWGRQPLMSFTDPSTSSTGRSVLYALYSVAAEKPADQLTLADVTDQKVVNYVKSFQQGVDHYVPNTLILQTKMTLGYGHLYWIAEDVLVSLKQGKAPVVAPPGTQIHPLAGKDMVFIYPKEGSIPHNNPLGIVDAPWVSEEQAEAARQWIAYLREPAQQEAIMDAGFRPATAIPYRCPICANYGLDPNQPTSILNPVDPAVAAAIGSSWDLVKKPGIVTFVVDASGSMHGTKLESAKEGVTKALDQLGTSTQVGFLAFNDGIVNTVPIAPIGTNKWALEPAVAGLRATGGTALYEAIEEAVRITDAASPGEEAIRGVVVLTDGKHGGRLPLRALASMSSREEVPILTFSGDYNTTHGTDQHGNQVKKEDILGVRLNFDTRNPIHIFFVGIGDADLEIGRILAEATNSACIWVTSQEKPPPSVCPVEDDLTRVLESFGKYF